MGCRPNELCKSDSCLNAKVTTVGVIAVNLKVTTVKLKTVMVAVLRFKTICFLPVVTPDCAPCPDNLILCADLA